MEPPSPTHLHVRPWTDTVVDQMGHDPRSAYVEAFWLGILGPSTTWLLRLLAHRLDTEPDGFDLELRTAARAIGLGPVRGRHSPLRRAIDRTVTFGLARPAGRDGLDVRRHLPPLTREQVQRLPRAVRRRHQEWQDQLVARDRFLDAQQRARRLALSLFETGEDPDAVERTLHRWHYHPALASAATTWALDRHRAAAAAALNAPG
jgi:hypothetical protein